MLKVRKNKTIILGLSDENIKRLQANQPIRFKMSDLIEGDQHTVFIIAGKTEESMALTLNQMTQSQN